MFVDKVPCLVPRNELAQVDRKPPSGICDDVRSRYRASLTYTAVRALSLGVGHSEPESDGMAGEIMCRPR
ncbi:hypothetical protein [Burkholderia mayonis]|uniref:Uncharacterized protein n=1 Tax=Burkholderia mayonis TaxID=1385591 RepID=A0A1B4G4R3_9BURK|nr:hypothetical protein [Burkholderia mayonis]AOJ10910.1 hypothetical protein WS71_27640 [Burkholderia mayonis]KVE48509.1 hypothetical protein WS71_17765 [Burkholderia mayonis]